MSRVAGDNAGDRDPHVKRAVRLFEFLGRAQQLKVNSPRTVDRYDWVQWFGDAPDHPAIKVGSRADDVEPGSPFLTADRVPPVYPPSPDDVLQPWLDGDIDDPHKVPELRDSIASAEIGTTEDVQLTLAERPRVRDEYGRWLTDWTEWAQREKFDRPARQLYGELFSAYVSASSHPEDLEIVVGIGCLAWRPLGGEPIKRHLLTAPVTIQFDDSTGRLSVESGDSFEPLKVELDMLDPGIVKDPQHISDVREDARSFESHPIDRQTSGEIVRRLVHTLDGDGEYRDTDDVPGYGSHALAAFAPALILRSRSQQGLVDIFDQIVSQLAESNDVPEGVIPLIDPDYRPAVAAERADGALVTIDEEPVLPMPLNDRQLQVLQHVDTNAQTLVQGPPGTGKTHTAAALLSHLLAQGKRVLVTAHTDRALKEVRAKLPERIKPLSVAVVGRSREEMSDLKVAVAKIASQASQHNAAVADAEVRVCFENIEQLRRERADLYLKLVNARELEVHEHAYSGYEGTLAGIARKLQENASHHDWLSAYEPIVAGTEPPLTNDEIAEWYRYQTDSSFAADEPESRQRLLDPGSLLDPTEFANQVAAEHRATAALEKLTALRNHPAFAGISKLGPKARAELQARLRGIAEEARSLAERHESWMASALSDVRSGRGGIWRARRDQIAELVVTATPAVHQLGHLTNVTAPLEALGPLTALAGTLREFIERGGTIKTDAAGGPKIGAFSPKPIKQAQAFFQQVRVNGVPPSTHEQLAAFQTWAHATTVLSALDKAWPESVQVPREDTLRERLQWHATELEQLDRVIRLGDALASAGWHLSELRLLSPDWSEVADVETYATVIDAAATNDEARAATHPLAVLHDELMQASRWANSAPSVRELETAVRDRDHEAYARAYARLERLTTVRRMAKRHVKLSMALTAGAPALSRAISDNPSDSVWSDRLASFTEAWSWASASSWIRQQSYEDINALQAEIRAIEDQLRGHVESIAATRAWAHAVAPDRLTGAARAHLELYAALVKRLGKGTGKYAAQRRMEIRKAMDECRPAVPVWIMPIYRIAEQLPTRA